MEEAVARSREERTTLASQPGARTREREWVADKRERMDGDEGDGGGGGDGSLGRARSAEMKGYLVTGRGHIGLKDYPAYPLFKCMLNARGGGGKGNHERAIALSTLLRGALCARWIFHGGTPQWRGSPDRQLLRQCFYSPPDSSPPLQLPTAASALMTGRGGSLSPQSYRGFSRAL